MTKRNFNKKTKRNHVKNSDLVLSETERQAAREKAFKPSQEEIDTAVNEYLKKGGSIETIVIEDNEDAAIYGFNPFFSKL